MQHPEPFSQLTRRRRDHEPSPWDDVPRVREAVAAAIRASSRRTKPQRARAVRDFASGLSTLWAMTQRQHGGQLGPEAHALCEQAVADQLAAKLAAAKRDRRDPISYALTGIRDLWHQADARGEALYDALKACAREHAAPTPAAIPAFAFDAMPED